MESSLSDVEPQRTSWVYQASACTTLPVPLSGPTKEAPEHCKICNISSDDENIRVQSEESSSLFGSVNRKKGAALKRSEPHNPRAWFFLEKKKRKEIIIIIIKNKN